MQIRLRLGLARYLIAALIRMFTSIGFGQRIGAEGSNFLPAFSGGRLFRETCSRNIYRVERRGIGFYVYLLTLNVRWHGRKRAHSVNADGNHVNLGNFDHDGLNVNNNWDDNWNGNLGLVSARNFGLTQTPLSGRLLLICCLCL